MIDFIPHPDISIIPSDKAREEGKIYYKYDYESIFRDIANGTLPEVGTYRELILNDLFFIVYFVMKIPIANRPFVVQACQEVEDGPDGWTMDLWARFHFKSSIITKARTIQRVLKYPNKCTMIASHTRPIAKKFLRPIMLELETNELLKACFPDVLWQNARSESPKWSEDDGIVVKRDSKSRGESTVEAWGIKEGMPISVHFDWILLDDLETKDDVRNPDIVHKVREAIDLTTFLLTEGGSISVIGTPYSHEGVYIPYIRDLKKANGKPKYLFRKKPGTVDATPNGKPVLITQEEMDDIKVGMDEYNFNTQILINPTPAGTRKLSGHLLADIDDKFIPKNVFKFMVIDPAGDDKTGKGSSWAILCIGVEPKVDEIGASNVYVLDALITPLREKEAPDEVARMYLRNGIIQQMGVEKVSQSSAEIHIANILEKRGRRLSIESGTLVILRPGQRNKVKRIESALAWPLYNSKLFISKSVPYVYRERMRTEMDKFPFWQMDGIDALSYIYDMIKDYRFHFFDEDEDERPIYVDKTGMNNTTGY